MRLLILNGPNLNLLGVREPEIYGSTTLGELERGLGSTFPELDFTFAQSNVEGELIDAIQQADADGLDGVVFNPGGFAHTSVALRDAIVSVRTRVVEVHISNVYAREDFRREMILSGVCEGIISGFGMRGYYLAVQSFL